MAEQFMTLNRYSPPLDISSNPLEHCQGHDAGRSGNNGGGITPSQIASSFASNFNYFQEPGTPFVTRASLENVANRGMSADPYHNQMTMLAREILTNPQMRMLDGINHGGHEDGRISQGDADATVAYFQGQEMPSSGRPQRQQSRGDCNGGMRHSLMNPIPLVQNYDQSSPYNGGAAFQTPSAGYPQYGQGSMSAPRPYANDSNEDLANKVLARFGALEDPNTPGFITDKSLSSIASGYHLDGRRATQDEMDLAREMQSRGGLFKQLDQGKTGTLDGRFSRDDLGEVSNEFRNMSDHDLLQNLKENFGQISQGDYNGYVNFDEVKKAAGVMPSDTTYSPQVRALAQELLKRQPLLNELDIGTNGNGGKGYKDQRFDIANIDYLMEKRR
ncbi:hypothetical protein C4K03_2703 [Pseudomonas synxantha]|uniref:Uncharacterized protein n=1 Tax=Pseudomonas synxantha TaxID=47883 RepID=A0A3G7U8E3_9PSED|nr:hypothetical protein [Pseudomonas synxantha]AZE54858.1 hypothetical protein C4K03_2703 [Pseudomonas synxantha]